jgi:hypothetical protein
MQNYRTCSNDLCSGALKRDWAAYEECGKDSSSREKQTFEAMGDMDNKQREAECLTMDLST